MQAMTYEPWAIAVNGFEKETQGQIESIFCQGNGCLGVRFAAPLAHVGRQRDTFVAGMYDAFDGEVAEIVNFPDTLGLRLWANGEELTMEQCVQASRRLELRTGVALAHYTLQGARGPRVILTLERMISAARLHLLAQRVTLESDEPCDLRWRSIIDGQVTNGGTQHFRQGVRRCLVSNAWRMTCATARANVGATIAVTVQTEADHSEIIMENRRVGCQFSKSATNCAAFTQFVSIRTTHDAYDHEASAADTAEAARRCGFDALLQESASAWADYWDKADLRVQSRQPVDQTAVRFALYHLRVMTPMHDARMNIGAKGLSGEAYKGHTFWDTEMFLLAPWLCIDPDVAKKLMQYRVLSLPKAREKAIAMGCRGALFPWESAWPTDGEMTPAEGDPDVVTGLPIPIRTGTDEIHVSADVALGVWHYAQWTGDSAFLLGQGGDILAQTALYWATRAEWNAQNQRYEINNVIGPDEYSEHSNNNAYTNLLAHWNLQTALALGLLHGKDAEQARRVADGLYLPKPDERGVIPQADGWTELPELDLSPFKGKVASILKRYNVDQLASYQVAKQADVIAYLSLFPKAYSSEVQAANFDYYEPRCLHDSSLSYSTYCLTAARLGRAEEAYRFFEKARGVDLNDGTTSVAGIHAAAMGGIWQCVVQGFAGLREENGQLIVRPHLPEVWTRIAFSCAWHGERYDVDITREGASIQRRKA